MIKNSFIQERILIDGREVYKPLQPTVPSVARHPSHCSRHFPGEPSPSVGATISSEARNLIFNEKKWKFLSLHLARIWREAPRLGLRLTSMALGMWHSKLVIICDIAISNHRVEI
jgi:hypothetical protein